MDVNAKQSLAVRTRRDKADGTLIFEERMDDMERLFLESCAEVLKDGTIISRTRVMESF